jgi:hypothetical protein
VTPIVAIIHDVGGGLIVVIVDDEDNDKLFNPPFFLRPIKCFIWGYWFVSFNSYM